MKICYLMSSFEGGGAAATLPDLLNLLGARGHSVDMIACERRDMKIVQEIEKANVPWSILDGEKYNKFIKILFFLSYVKKTSPDLIWTSHSRASFIGQVVGKITGIPVVSWKNLAFSRLYTHLTKNIPKFWIADSHASAIALQKDLNIKENNILTWPLFECSSISLPKEKIFLKDNILHIGSLGRLHPSKQYHILIKAIAELKKKYPDLKRRLQIHIAGDGLQKQELVDLAHSFKIDDIIIFHGFIGNIIPFLDKLDVYIQPSFVEGLCLGVHEAMSRKIPVIATKTGELPYIVKTGQTGVLLESKDGDKCVQSCVKAIDFFLNNPELCEIYGNNAYNLIWENYKPTSFIKKGHEILEKIEKFISGDV